MLRVSARGMLSAVVEPDERSPRGGRPGTNQGRRAAVLWAGQEGDLDALDAIISRDFVPHDPASPEEVRGVEGVTALAEAYRRGLSDLQLTIDHQLAEGDYVAARWRARGTHDGELIGVPATGRKVEIAGITISRCRDGKTVEEWEISDVFGLLQQIGAATETVAS